MKILIIFAAMIFAVQLHAQTKTFPINRLSVSYKNSDGTYNKVPKDTIFSGNILLKTKNNKEVLVFTGTKYDNLGLTNHDFVIEKTVNEGGFDKKYYKCGVNMVVWNPKNHQFSFWNGKIDSGGRKRFNHFSYDTCQ